MTKPCALRVAARRRRIGQLALPLAVLCGAVLLGVQSQEENDLWAGSADNSRTDSDGDGITDEQEEILGTSPDDPDTDQDGYSDLEELARGSDPSAVGVLPESTDLALGMYAHAKDGIVRLSTALYVKGGNMNGLNLDIGLIIDGEPAFLGGKVFRNSTSIWFFDTNQAPTDRIILFESAVPEGLVQWMGKLDVFALINDTSPLQRLSEVSITELVDFGGVTVRLEDAPGGMSPGIIYRPLGNDEEIPEDWAGGQVCWQKTTPAGMNGTNVVYEVDEASCEDMDSFCSGSQCSASVGGTQERPDPGALLGG